MRCAEGERAGGGSRDRSGVAALSAESVSLVVGTVPQCAEEVFGRIGDIGRTTHDAAPIVVLVHTVHVVSAIGPALLLLLLLVARVWTVDLPVRWRVGLTGGGRDMRIGLGAMERIGGRLGIVGNGGRGIGTDMCGGGARGGAGVGDWRDDAERVGLGKFGGRRLIRVSRVLRRGGRGGGWLGLLDVRVVGERGRRRVFERPKDNLLFVSQAVATLWWGSGIWRIHHPQSHVDCMAY